jgi:hypothetical protein
VFALKIINCFSTFFLFRPENNFWPFLRFRKCPQKIDLSFFLQKSISFDFSTYLCKSRTKNQILKQCRHIIKFQNCNINNLYSRNFFLLLRHHSYFVCFYFTFSFNFFLHPNVTLNEIHNKQKVK